MPFKNSGLQVQEYVYDYSVDGGVKDVAILLSDKAGYDPLPIGATVVNVVARVETTVESSGSATVEWGPGANTDGYSGTAIAKATLVANYAHTAQQGAGAELWDNTNDANLAYAVTSTANTRSFAVLINTENLSAGKIRFYVSYHY